MPTDLQPTIESSIVEAVLLHGDLAKLTPAQRVSYYKHVCDSVGLNPLTQPFAYIALNGKLVLYALRTATDQLRRLSQVSITITAREFKDDLGQYIVTARASLPDGRTDESIGAVPIKNLMGEALSNALMKAETKSKRRVTLAICGLGLLDETEVDSIPSAGPSMGAYATVPAPPLEDDAPRAELPEGAVLIDRLDSAPTKNPKITKYFITLSDGTKASTINAWLASLAEQLCQDRIPVRAKVTETKWGLELKALARADDPDQPMLDEPPSVDEIPF
jgi:hypothetical protein